MRTVISGGTVVTATGTMPADVWSTAKSSLPSLSGMSGNERLRTENDIPGQAQTWAVTADRVIDATGKYVLPGGIDAHTHMDMPFGGTFVRDDFETGPGRPPRAAPPPSWTSPSRPRATSLRPALDTWHEKAEGKCAVDYAFHMIVTDVNDGVAEGDGRLHRRQGVNSFKMFMAYPGVFYVDRRRNPARHAAGGQVRRDDHDARGERHRDRPARGRRPWPRARPTRCTTA